MANKNSKPANGKSDVADGFRISGAPVIRLAEDEQSSAVRDFGDVVELPRVYGAPILFAIARDPRTIFTYWNIDWPTIFAKTAPVDRQVHLRVRGPGGIEETSAAVEPIEMFAVRCVASVNVTLFTPMFAPKSASEPIVKCVYCPVSTTLKFV